MDSTHLEIFVPGQFTAELRHALRHGLQFLDMTQGQGNQKYSQSHLVPDDLGVKAVALGTLRNGFVESLRSFPTIPSRSIHSLGQFCSKLPFSEKNVVSASGGRDVVTPLWFS
ncbi:hypothetical protein GFL38_35580 [Rhizobium leguminosarum bv. viciae]|uniref:hypothetical protein n=1 Tax=Rhizobium ruizarguesonis TaxID=2081791 RepID=UPI00143F0B96|nr:hypothetical protein [Rhizobium ruizarguesonis]NKJ77471.1 hypothetical protein [Rhizobium leguminosarum bv. viciae]